MLWARSERIGVKVEGVKGGLMRRRVSLVVCVFRSVAVSWRRGRGGGDGGGFEGSGGGGGGAFEGTLGELDASVS